MADRPLGRPTDAQLRRLGAQLAVIQASLADAPTAYRLPPRTALSFTDAIELLANGARFRRAAWPAWKWLMRVTPQDFVWIGQGENAAKHGFAPFYAVSQRDHSLAPYALTVADFDATDWAEVAE
jgi:hypothetical protein